MARLEIRGIENLDFLDLLCLEGTFISVYNGMCKVTNGGVIDAYNKAFEKYFPDEYYGNETYDNAYCKLGFAINKEIADKLSETLGVLPGGKKVYLDSEEPITLTRDLQVDALRGYIA